MGKVISDTRSRPVAVDLFAGAGGLSLGLEQAGFDVAAAVEYDPVHAATHEYNFPQTEVICADVSAPLSPARVTSAVRSGLARHGRPSWNGEIDLLAGGPPCQGFSLIGKRLIDDSRNQLVFHFFRLVAELRPKYFVMENVPGMTRGGHAGILDALIAEFEDAGYRFPPDRTYKILNAADFGAPQDRKRLFLIGTRDDQAVTATPPEPIVRPVPKRVGMKTRPVLDDSLPPGPTVADAIADLPNPTDFEELIDSDVIRLSGKKQGVAERGASKYARVLRGIEDDSHDFSYPRSFDVRQLGGCIRTNHTEKSIRRFSETEPGTTEPISRFYRLDPSGLCNTLRAGSGSERGAFTSPRPLHPIFPRVLSNREAARLHSFPDWFRPHSTKWHGFRQIGNAVVPLVGRAVGAQIMAALGEDPVKPTRSYELGSASLLDLTMSEAAARFGAEPGSIPAGRTRGASTADTSSDPVAA